jgi:major membrane immunogen (membrane-anchored lipoprotein)
LLPVLPLALLLVTCGGSDQGGIRATWTTFVRAECDKAHACRGSYSGTAAEFEYDYGASAAACASVVQGAEFDLVIGLYEAAEADGRLAHNAANAQTCFSAMRAQSCADFWQGVDPSPACDVIFTGKIANGGTCTVPDECVSAACDDSMICV